MSTPRLHQVQMLVNYMKLGRWMARNGFGVAQRVPNRYAVFAAIAERIRDQQVLYLEFGVYQGASIRWWSRALQHPEARLHGFDSFEGLPEDFDVDGPYAKGTFDVQGRIPEIDDPRVTFFKGWFEDVLPTYELPAHEVLVVTLDADLYSATQYVLNHLAPHIQPGTYLYFDDLSRPEHEPRAFEAFIAAHGRRFQLVAADYSLNAACFECVE